MLGGDNKFGWNARMMVWIGLIIIVSYSLNRFIGRNDCIDSKFVKKVTVVGDPNVSEIASCQGQSTYDFSVDHYSALIAETNKFLKNFSMEMQPVDVTLNISKKFLYQVSERNIQLGSEMFGKYLVRALVESQYGPLLPGDESREFYLDFLAEAHGATSPLPGSIHIIHYLAGASGYCSLPYPLPEDLASCNQSGLPAVGKDFRRSLLLRPVVLGLWRLFYGALNENEQARFVEQVTAKNEMAKLPAMDFSNSEKIAETFLNLIDQMAAARVGAELQKRFSSFAKTAIRTQIRAGKLSVDFVMENISGLKAPVEVLAAKHGHRIMPSMLLGSDMRSSILNEKLQLEPYKITIRYWFRCVSHEQLKAGFAVRAARFARRLSLLLGCDEKVAWNSLIAGNVQEFMDRNPQLGLLQLYLPALSSAEVDSIGQLKVMGGNAAESTVNGEKIAPLERSSFGYKISGDSQIIEIYRPLKEFEKLVFVEGNP